MRGRVEVRRNVSLRKDTSLYHCLFSVALVFLHADPEFRLTPNQAMIFSVFAEEICAHFDVGIKGIHTVSYGGLNPELITEKLSLP